MTGDLRKLEGTKGMCEVALYPGIHSLKADSPRTPSSPTIRRRLPRLGRAETSRR